MPLWISPAAALVIGYLLGSVPFGLLLTRLSGAGDLRGIGSGNIGATNVLRTGRKGLAAATLLLDLAKGAAAVLIAEAIAPGLGQLGAVGAFFGHCFPVWLGFRGGKGVATTMGIVTALHPPLGLVYAVGWIGMLALTRISAVAGLTAAIAMPIAAPMLGRYDLLPLMLALALLIVWLHRANLARLARGQEPRVGSKANG